MMEQQLKVINNFFSNEEIKTIKNYVEEIFTEKEILSDDKIKNWHETLNTSNSKVDIYTLHPGIDSDVYHLIFEKMKKEFNMTPKAISFFFWQNGSYINWHNDSRHGGAATVYLNKTWNRYWGGFFVYHFRKKLGAEVPKFNKCIFQSGEVEHGTYPTTDQASVRKTIQVFFK